MVQRELQNSQYFTVLCSHLTASGQKQWKKELDRTEDLSSEQLWSQVNLNHLQCVFPLSVKDQLWNIKTKQKLDKLEACQSSF